MHGTQLGGTAGRQAGRLTRQSGGTRTRRAPLSNSRSLSRMTHCSEQGIEDGGVGLEDLIHESNGGLGQVPADRGRVWEGGGEEEGGEGRGGQGCVVQQTAPANTALAPLSVLHATRLESAGGSTPQGLPRCWAAWLAGSQISTPASPGGLPHIFILLQGPHGQGPKQLLGHREAGEQALKEGAMAEAGEAAAQL